MSYRDDLSAALSRADAAERALSGVCHVHPSVSAMAVCASCRKGICDACSSASVDGTFCSNCFVANAAARGRRRMLLVGGVVAAIGGAVGGFVLLGGQGSPNDIAKALPPKPSAGFVPPSAVVYPHRPNQVRILRDALVKEPCNRDTVLELAQLLNENLVFAETLELDQQFIAKCGAYPRLTWTSVYAHEQRSEWAAAATDATTLIRDEPTDSDFWWWRGQDRAQQGELVAAGADLRQALANGGYRHAAFRYAAVAEKLKQPCEAAFAIKRYVDSDEAAGRSPEVRTQLQDLYAAGGCAAREGQGKAVIKLKPDAPLVLVKVKIGAATGSFVVDPRSAYLSVSKAFAVRAGLAPAEGAPAVSTVILGSVSDARLAVADQVDVEGASAPAVDVAVAETLPPDLDGVVGLSFLWRFAFERDDAAGKITISAWERKR